MLFSTSIVSKTIDVKGVMHGCINNIVYCLKTFKIKGLIKPNPKRLVSISKCKPEILEKCKKYKLPLQTSMLTLNELKNLCKERGIKGYSNKKKEELINILSSSSESEINNENLGKEFEKAVCIYYDIEFKGNFKYSIENAKRLAERLTPLKELWAPSAEHTANNRSSHDFTYLCDGLSRHLSLKTNKSSGGKVCPQVIGQPTSKTFRKHFGLSEDVNIKDYITNNFPSMLEKYWNNAYDVPMLYYNEKEDKIYYIKPSYYPEFEKEHLTLGKVGKDWNESTTLKYKGETIGEFQLHNHRDCIKFRWNHKNLMNNMDIIEF